MTTTAVAVPADFCGMQFFGFPQRSGAAGTGDSGVLTTVPTSVPYGVTYDNDWRSRGPYGPHTWPNIETSAGVYDWTNLDIWVAAHAARGANICYSLLYCPSFYSVNSTQASTWSGYPGVGGPLTSPAGLTGVANFITTLVTRYKARGTPIKYLQCWQEPWFPITLGTGFWWGAKGDLVDLCYRVYTAAKAADSTITVLSPSVIKLGVGGGPSDFWLETGTVNTTVSGKDTCDWWGMDPFNLAPYSTKRMDGQDNYAPIKDSKWRDPPYDLVTAIQLIQTQMGATVKPIAITSLGIDAVGNLAFSTYLLAQTAAWRKQYLGRLMLAAAALGVKFCIVYGYDGATFGVSGGPFYWTGDLTTDTNGVLAAYLEIAANLPGKTISSSWYQPNGTIRALFSNGTYYSI